MPSNTRNRNSVPVRGSPETACAGDQSQQASSESEGAVGFQLPSLPLNSVSINDHVVVNNPNDLLIDNDNNNVDENSNDHQYNEYAEYHQQFDQHEYVARVQEEHLTNNDQSTGNGIYQRLPRPNEEPDSVSPSSSHYAIRRDSVSLHRRNYSEDYSLSTHNLPPLPCRSSNNDRGVQGQWLPSLSRRALPSVQDVQQEARELLNNFTVEEFRLQSVELPEMLQPGYSDPAWISTGRDLRILAEAFSKSQERSIVRRRAQKVSMASMTMDNFFLLCTELFRGNEGISQERIVVLFTFISDVAIQHVMLGAERFLRQLMDWSLRYICDRICCWVQENGGWGAVLSRGASVLYNWTMFTLAAFSIIALGMYIKKSWNEL